MQESGLVAIVPDPTCLVHVVYLYHCNAHHSSLVLFAVRIVVIRVGVGVSIIEHKHEKCTLKCLGTMY
jgi:hypothetical protein